MSNILVTSPYRPFTLPNQFKVVFNGYIYCGAVDAVDPSVSQVQVYLVNEDGSKVPVSQPLRTNAGGFIVYNGQPAKFVTDSNHSLLVRDSLGKQIWYEPNMASVDPDSLFSVIRDTTATVFKNEFGRSAVENMIAGRIGGVDGVVEHSVGNVYSTGRTSWEVVSFETNAPLANTTPQLYARNMNTIWANDFGAIGDGVNDDHGAITAAINYINSYVFKPSAGEIRDFPPNRKGGTVKLAPGSYRVTKTIFLNPFVILDGETGIGFSSAPTETGSANSTVTAILCDFGTNTERFVVDTAPWVISTQSRDNGIGSWTGAEIDAGVVSSVRGVEVHNITFARLKDSDPVVFGALRLGAAQNHYCTRLHVEPNHFKVGVMRFAAWGGAVNDCYLRATHCALATVDTTTADAKGNYLSTPNKVIDMSGLPAWYTSDDDSIWDKQRPVHCMAHRSTVNVDGTILEGGFRGLLAKSKSVITGGYVYAEAVAGTVTDAIGLKDALFGIKECSFITIGMLKADNCANVASAFFGNVEINNLSGDLAGSVSSSPTFAANISSTSKIRIRGAIQTPADGTSPYRYLANQAYYQNVDFMEISERGLNTFYVSPTGNDTRMGIDDNTALATIDEAVKRAVSANKDADILIKGDASYVINMFDFKSCAIRKRVRFIKNGGAGNPSIKATNSGANANGFIFAEGAVIEFDRVDLLHILAGASLQAGFDSMIECAGTVSINAKNCYWDGLSGSNRPFFGTKYKQVSKVSIQMNECSLNNMKMSSNSDGNNGRMIVDLITLNTTRTAVTGWSTQVQVLHSDVT